MTPIVFITKMDGGGMETFCLELLREWASRGREATLYASFPGGVRDVDVPPGAERVCWNVRARRSFCRIARWLRTRPDDPCLALSQELAVVLAVLKKLRLIRNRVYYRESTDVARHYGRAFKLTMRWLWPVLDGVIEQSRSGEEETRLICRGRLPKCLVVRNVMPAPEIGRGFEIADRSCVRLACLGSFKPMKGQGNLVEGLGKDAADGWRLTFWGDGERRSDVERLVGEKGFSDRITFHDWERDRAKIYETCDVVVIPSDYEGLPNVMLEAILHGKRVSVRPTCIGACELLREIGLPETWPWRSAMEIDSDAWTRARRELAEVCAPKKVAEEVLSFMSQ